MLDAGCGELTTLSHTISKLSSLPKRIHAFDISWSRLSIGREYMNNAISSEDTRICPFVADMSHIPMPDNSVDIITTNHALEPNGPRLRELVEEMLRVTRDKLILFEPSYETNSKEGRERMDRLGYIKGLQATAEQLGARTELIQPMSTVANPLNPTVCHIFSVPESQKKSSGKKDPEEHSGYSVPGTSHQLLTREDCLYAPDYGISFPVIGGIPLLRKKYAVLTSLMSKSGS